MFGNGLDFQLKVTQKEYYKKITIDIDYRVQKLATETCEASL